jgi:putative chitinase
VVADQDTNLVAATVAAVTPSMSPADRAAWVAALVPAMRAGGLLSVDRAAMFIGQCAEETGGFRATEESLFYATAGRICAVWPSRFATVAQAAPYVGQPQKLANHVYALRGGNGPETSGDGWAFRGGGLLQVTFRDAYTQLGKAVGKTPEGCADWVRNTKDGSATASVWAWHKLSASRYADAWNIPAVSGLLNTGNARSPLGAIVNYQARVTACNTARLAARAARAAAQ